jgi:hypothetical protein
VITAMKATHWVFDMNADFRRALEAISDAPAID